MLQAKNSLRGHRRLTIMGLALAGVVVIGLALVPACTRQDRANAQSTTTASSAGRTLADQLSATFEAAASKVSPSVIPIFAEQVVEVANPFSSPDSPFRDFFGDDFFKRYFGTVPQQDQKQTVHSLGSGVIVSQDGYILTNNHVVQGADKLTVLLEKNKKYPAKIVGTDPQTDLAVIKIDGKDLPAATLGDSDGLKIGEWVIAVGNPFQLFHTVTAGIISAQGRSSVGLADYEDFIQTDASINPGNSGGALADLDGKVIGINTAISSPSGGNVGIGFAIPINMAKSVMDNLIAHGKVTRGYLGLVPQDIDDNLAAALKLKSTAGALVGDVVPGGPADKGGVQRGDVITELNGKNIKDSVQLRQLVAQAEPGSTVQLTLLRNGKEITASVKLGERPKDTAAGAQQPQQEQEPQLQEKLGLSIQNLTPDLAQQLGYEHEQGVLVADVAAGSAGEDAGLRRGDLIQEVNRQAVSSVADFNKVVAKLKSGDSAALLVRRGQVTFFTAIQVP
jgi:serine protease Do